MHRSDFPPCQISGGGRASTVADPITGRAPQRRRQWDKTSEVPEVHGASHWWALSRAVKPHFLEAILARTGATSRAGSVDAGTSVGDSSAEARRHKMGVGLTAVTTNFMGDSYTFIDCPGSVEFAHDMRSALPAVDAAVVVCEADEKKLPQLQIILRELEDLTFRVFCFSTRSTAPTSAFAKRLRPCSRRRESRWCCARSRSGTAT